MKQIKVVMVMDISDEGYTHKQIQDLEAEVLSGEFAVDMLRDGAKHGVTNVVCEWEVKDKEE